jgi:hypothetical protein
MAYSNYEAVKRFVNGKTKGGSHNIFADGDTLYSFGHHFPMLVRRDFGFLLNGDKYSVSTSAHQSLCRLHAHVQLPFSLLQKARVPYTEVSIINRGQNPNPRPIRWYKQILMRTGKYNRWGSLASTHNARVGYLYITDNDYHKLPQEYKGNWNQYHDYIGHASVLFHQEQYYLLVEERWGQYSLSQLPRKAKTVKKASVSLIPEKIRDSDYQQQGEWLFVEIKNNANAKTICKQMQPKFTMPNPTDNYNAYIATRGCILNGDILVSGQIRNPYHRQLVLSKSDNPKIFKAYHNLATESWR